MTFLAIAHMVAFESFSGPSNTQKMSKKTNSTQLRTFVSTYVGKAYNELQ